jgi:hypothetical protein
MIKNFSQLTVKIENLDFFLNCEVNATFPMVKEALFQFQKAVGSIEDQIKAQQAQAEADKLSSESPVIDENKPAEIVEQHVE